MIQVKNISKNFGTLRAVQQLSLEVPPGEIFAFLGPNGAGKTTTLKIMAGVLAPNSGDVEICGYSILRDPLKAKAVIGYIPDRPFLYEKLTGYEFLHFVGGLYNLGKEELKKEIAAKLTLFDLWDWRRELIEGYSHGMKQRLVICSALIHHPKVLIVDEPMVGLDPRGTRLVKRIFQKESAEGMSIFMSTHTLSTAQEIAHRIGIIHKGSLIALGTPESLARETDRHSPELEPIFLKLTGESEEYDL